MTQAPLPGGAAAVVGLAAFGAVALDAGWQLIRHGTVMAHEGAHAVFGSLLFRNVSGIQLNADATGGTRRVAPAEAALSGRMQQGPLHV